MNTPTPNWRRFSDEKPEPGQKICWRRTTEDYVHGPIYFAPNAAREEQEWIPYPLDPLPEPKQDSTKNNTMEPYQKRIIDELAELDTKRNALTEFIGGVKWRNLDAQEKSRLNRQLEAMSLYSGVLHERVASWQLTPKQEPDECDEAFRAFCGAHQSHTLNYYDGYVWRTAWAKAREQKSL